MPNWCDNSVTISGPKDQLNRIRKAVANGSLFEEFVPIPKVPGSEDKDSDESPAKPEFEWNVSVKKPPDWSGQLRTAR